MLINQVYLKKPNILIAIDYYISSFQ